MWTKVAKWVIYIVPVVIFALFLNSGMLLKRPMGKNDDVMGGLHAIEQAVLSEDWAKAGEAWQRTHKAIDKVHKRIEVQAERDELHDFEQNLALLRGSIQAQERPAALEHISLLKNLFDDFGQ